MKAEFIIEKPERQRPLQRATFALITMVAWTLWISLWMPVLTAIAWLLGLQNAYEQLGLMHPLHAVGDLKMVAMVALASSLSIGTWAQYNRIRFSGKQRRRGNRPLDIAEMAPALATSLNTAKQLRTGRRSVIHFTDNGHMYLTDDAGSPNG
jgi:biofilm PGA synthesis protein PgaD